MARVQTLAVRLLNSAGHLDVDGVESAALGSRKARALLWLLALGRGTFVAPDVIVESLWGDGVPARPADQLAVLVSRLRGVLGRDRIQHGDAGYGLHYDWLDVDEVEALTGEITRRMAAANPPGAAAAARVCLALLRRPPSCPDGSGEWAATQVVALERLVARARRVCADALLASGAWLDAVDVAAETVAQDPYDEHALRVVMRANAAGGRTAAALASYAAASQRYVAELGTDPSAETQTLHAAILRGEPAVSGSSAEGVGVARSTLVGRAPQLSRLDAAVERAREWTVQVVVVEGEAGIGKTSLAQDWTSRRPDIDVVLFGRCGERGRSAPLDPLLGVLSEHLRSVGADRTAEILAGDAPLIAPLLGLSSASTMPPTLGDGIVGPTLLYVALSAVIARITPSGVLVLVLDDAHRAGPALAEWLQLIRNHRIRLLVVATVRTPGQAPVPATETLHLVPLDPDQTRELVGDDRADALFARSGGHPLFLSELALSTDDDLPASLVDAVSARCDSLDRAGETLRNAAVVGDRVDPELLASVLNRPTIEILDDAELGVKHQLLVDDDGAFRFRHALVREALSATASAGRVAWLHRQVARVLARRPDADPMDVGDHARRGGDVELAASSLRVAAARAGERFDLVTAEALLDDAVALHSDPVTWLERARVRTRRGEYAAAYRDVDRAAATGASALEVGAWASYFDRRFAQAAAFAADGAAIADDDAVRARCLAVAGRTQHAAGDLKAAEGLLLSAIEGAHGIDRSIASSWLGVLRSHQSRPADALELLRPVTRPELRAEHTSAVLHALLFTGHAHALSGRPADALEALSRYSDEVDRRHVVRFEGRGTNFTGWVVRSLGASSEGAELHEDALEVSLRNGSHETRVAALEDLAEVRLDTGDPQAADRLLADAQRSLHGDLVFGWRLGFKLDLLRARSALAQGDPAAAMERAASLAARAGELGVPRYASVARLVAHRAQAALGEPVDLDVVAGDLRATAEAVALEAWWWIGDSAAVHGVPAWVDLAASHMLTLSANAGERGAALRLAASPRLDGWRAAAER